MDLAYPIIAAVIALVVLVTVMRSVRIVPQARARNVERFGRYQKTLQPGMNFIIPVGRIVDVMQIEGATALVYPRE